MDTIQIPYDPMISLL